MFAVIETGGKQYKVAAGDVVTVEKLAVEAGSAYSFDKVLAVLDGENARFGAPYLDGVTVSASVVGDGKGKKVVAYKYKAKKGYHRKKGHRQPYTKLVIEAVNG